MPKILRYAWMVKFTFYNPSLSCAPSLSNFFLGKSPSTAASSVETANTDPTLLWTQHLAYSYNCGANPVQGIRLYRNGVLWSLSPFEPVRNLSFSYELFDSICSSDSCRIDCGSSPDGFCCIDHAVTNRLLQVLTT